jgi:hypothetical protein
MLLRAVEHDATLKRHRYVLMPATPPEFFSEDDQRLIAERCTAVVLKPFDVDDVLRAVDAAADGPLAVDMRFAPDSGSVLASDSAVQLG